jgi:hypothetical protein
MNSEATSDDESDPAHQFSISTGQPIKIRTRWSSATKAKITPATKGKRFSSMSDDFVALHRSTSQFLGDLVWTLVRWKNANSFNEICRA